MSTVIEHSETTLSAADRDKAMALLSENRDRVLETVGPLDEEQWTFRSAAGVWTILENLEHIVIVERIFQERIRSMPEAPLAGPKDVLRPESECLELMQQRIVRVGASEAVQPAARWTPPQALAEFRSAREETLELLHAPGLRGHIIPQRRLGNFDGYRWLLAAVGHASRHLAQIQEVMSAATFPARQSI